MVVCICDGWLQYHEKSIIPRLAPNLNKYLLFVLSQYVVSSLHGKVIYMFQFSNVENCL